MGDKIVRCPKCGAEMAAIKPVSFYSLEHRTKWGCYYECKKCMVWQTQVAFGYTAQEAKTNAYKMVTEEWEGET